MATYSSVFEETPAKRWIMPLFMLLFLTVAGSAAEKARYVAEPNTKLYHLSTCPLVAKDSSAASMLTYFASVEAAQADGLKPCCYCLREEVQQVSAPHAEAPAPGQRAFILGGASVGPDIWMAAMKFRLYSDATTASYIGIAMGKSTSGGTNAPGIRFSDEPMSSWVKKPDYRMQSTYYAVSYDLCARSSGLMLGFGLCAYGNETYDIYRSTATELLWSKSQGHRTTYVGMASLGLMISSHVAFSVGVLTSSDSFGQVLVGF